MTDGNMEDCTAKEKKRKSGNDTPRWYILGTHPNTSDAGGLKFIAYAEVPCIDLQTLAVVCIVI